MLEYFISMPFCPSIVQKSSFAASWFWFLLNLLFLNYFTGFLSLTSLKISYSISFSSIWVTLRMSALSCAIFFSSLQSVIHTAILSNYGLRFKTIPATIPSVNCSPIMARRRSSQYLEQWLFGILRVNLAPSWS